MANLTYAKSEDIDKLIKMLEPQITPEEYLKKIQEDDLIDQQKLESEKRIKNAEDWIKSATDDEQADRLWERAMYASQGIDIDAIS